MSNLEDLLRRHHEGRLTPEQQSELDRLTHRSQVIDAANRRAKVLWHRQVAGITGVASVLLVAGGIFFVNPSATPSGNALPTVAKADVPETTVVETTLPLRQDEAVPVAKPIPAAHKTKCEEESPIQPSDIAPIVTPAPPQSLPVEPVNDIPPAIVPETETIVACNTACSPDSVISDIWKFLRT